MYVEVEVTPAGIEKITFNAEVDGYHSSQTMSEFMEQVRDAREVAFSAKNDSSASAVPETNVAPVPTHSFEDRYRDKISVEEHPHALSVWFTSHDGEIRREVHFERPIDAARFQEAFEQAIKRVWG